MRATQAVEAAGVPAVPVIARGFAAMARGIGRAIGLAELPIAVYPGVIPTDGDDVFERNVVEQVAPAVIASLVERAAPASANAAAADPGPREIVFSGGLDELQDHFAEQGWSDGLPVVPPTLERVERFLRFTDRDPDESIGVLPPESREATVWNVAVNGVMAGCRPEYMPILLAVADAVGDPGFRLA